MHINNGCIFHFHAQNVLRVLERRHNLKMPLVGTGKIFRGRLVGN